MRLSPFVACVLLAALVTTAGCDRPKPSRERSASPDPTETSEPTTSAPVATATTAAAATATAPKPAALGTVTVGRVTSDIPVPEAELVVGSFQADFSRCYEDALKNAPATSGHFDLVVTVEPTGSIVGMPRVERAGTLPSELTACASKALASARFRGFAGHRATVRVPLTFSVAQTAAKK